MIKSVQIDRSTHACRGALLLYTSCVCHIFECVCVFVVVHVAVVAVTVVVAALVVVVDQ